ncbi:protein TBATA [Myxocyprinus asiaticus]|uniref:protein TBATA n=1 Tax=Myxocyprinus asiaticus TaxID=70543 RepID=UPI002222801B|nr:protein TBATA [Myxocyprinus asiaticus]
MDSPEDQASENVSRMVLGPEPVQSESRREKWLCDTPGTSRSTTRGSVRFGTLSHHSFFSRHNPHPHRVKHIEGLNGKPVCMVNDDWYGFTPLCPHPLIKSQVPVSVNRFSAFHTPEISPEHSGQRAALISESWREELKDLATKVSLSAAAETHSDKREKFLEEEVPRRKTQYSAQSGRIIPSTSWDGKKRNSKTSYRRLGTQRWQTHTLDGLEIRVLELLCQILQTDSLSLVQQWLLLANDREKEMVQGLLQQAMADLSSLTQQTSGSELLPFTSEHVPDHVLLNSSVSHRQQRMASSHPAEALKDKPERIGEAEVLTLRQEDT